MRMENAQIFSLTERSTIPPRWREHLARETNQIDKG